MVLFIAGSFDINGGKKSGLAQKFYDVLKNYYNNIDFYNGGNIQQLKQYSLSVKKYQIVIWWAKYDFKNIQLADIKSQNSRCMLICSKNNTSGDLLYSQIIQHTLSKKGNLCFVFKKCGNRFGFDIYDPLGNVLYSGSDITEAGDIMFRRIEFLKKLSRKSSICAGEKIEVPNKPTFFRVVKKWGKKFHQVINPDQKTRYLGNASFRCQRGFPSFRHKNYIFVSQRNIDKRYITNQNFVATYLSTNQEVKYYGDKKPSVDTPIQLELYNALPNINYIIHAHCYIKNAPFTNVALPCGAVEEASEILNLIENKNIDFVAINLKNHGCVVMSKTIKKFSTVQFVARPMPEQLK